MKLQGLNVQSFDKYQYSTCVGFKEPFLLAAMNTNMLFSSHTHNHIHIILRKCLFASKLILFLHANEIC